MLSRCSPISHLARRQPLPSRPQPQRAAAAAAEVPPIRRHLL
jgi:hypothetical protein